MTECYMGLILKTSHHLLIFLFSFVRVRRGEEILFLTSPNQCSYTCYQIYWPVRYP